MRALYARFRFLAFRVHLSNVPTLPPPNGSFLDAHTKRPKQKTAQTQNGPSTQGSAQKRPKPKTTHAQKRPRLKMAGVCILVRKICLFPVPFLKMIFIPPFTTHRFCCARFVVILPYLAFLLPFYFPFSLFFLFFCISPLFLFPFSYFFPR